MSAGAALAGVISTRPARRRPSIEPALLELEAVIQRQAARQVHVYVLDRLEKPVCALLPSHLLAGSSDLVPQDQYYVALQDWLAKLLSERVNAIYVWKTTIWRGALLDLQGPSQRESFPLTRKREGHVLVACTGDQRPCLATVQAMRPLVSCRRCTCCSSQKARFVAPVQNELNSSEETCTSSNSAWLQSRFNPMQSLWKAWTAPVADARRSSPVERRRRSSSPTRPPRLAGMSPTSSERRALTPEMTRRLARGQQVARFRAAVVSQRFAPRRASPCPSTSTGPDESASPHTSSIFDSEESSEASDIFAEDKHMRADRVRMRL
mmetsp:Transcript_52856/g.123688  ORF Transcript_52856/g.123688 Transcript_52856/m.123688 type:complete len:323 (+) Transcript_52856:50-1018(+)